ncbi:hypothetical protein RHMOL_Rhmol02G0025300 [Rhododendron molle]|uniref:Uncharacterized protein n=1 Tax=Rhododendron molle TaxID=49168 RepID=A0ACC0PNE1_RHOML|nr:hypothetical protein RHMOL_Rhmol02G0025300 [Rhododendron molle]
MVETILIFVLLCFFFQLLLSQILKFFRNVLLHSCSNFAWAHAGLGECAAQLRAVQRAVRLLALPCRHRLDDRTRPLRRARRVLQVYQKLIRSNIVKYTYSTRRALRSGRVRSSGQCRQSDAGSRTARCTARSCAAHSPSLAHAC